ncbi:carnitine dehydratase [Enemella evansiae]|uniref:CaiB/BaiF CoA transferase family protein n=1 Tax=Enemella evansiae TaxID=2016499 RepID=UPI000B96710B|nr:CaiB/BaiF CoA-transferase family protein [Enemella evansiae]OYO04894.1 carnitine dehydratase [Enemella evansiae]
MRPASGAGPLAGLRVLELPAIGPVPHAAMVLADLGAEVLRVDRRAAAARLTDTPPTGPEPILRGRTTVLADLKDPAELASVRRLAAAADVLIEGFRPGVAERLGLGPEECLAANPRLVYGRMTGWGQDGELAQAAGHDLNYLSLTGLLDNIGRPGERSVPPLNLVGDFGGGSMLLLVGVLAALWERERSGQGQVIDAAMVDGASMLGALAWSMRAGGAWAPGRGRNLVDGSHPFYDTYLCADGKQVAVACLEPQFFAAMVERLGVEPAEVPGQWDRDRWPELRALLTRVFASRTRDEWDAIYRGSDACVTPVLDFDEAVTDPHLRSRGTLVSPEGVDQPAPAPRFTRTPAELPPPEVRAPDGLADAVAAWES